MNHRKGQGYHMEPPERSRRFWSHPKGQGVHAEQGSKGESIF